MILDLSLSSDNNIQQETSINDISEPNKNVENVKNITNVTCVKQSFRLIYLLTLHTEQNSVKTSLNQVWRLNCLIFIITNVAKSNSRLVIVQ